MTLRARRLRRDRRICQALCLGLRAAVGSRQGSGSVWRGYQMGTLVPMRTGLMGPGLLRGIAFALPLSLLMWAVAVIIPLALYLG